MKYILYNLIMVLTRRWSYFFYITFSIIITIIASAFFLSIYKNNIEDKKRKLENDSYLLGEWINDSFKSTEYILKNIINSLPLGDIIYPPENNALYFEHKQQLSQITGVCPHTAFYGVIDSNGILSHSNSVDGFNLNSMEFFQSMKNTPSMKSVISNAFKSPEGYYYIIHGYNFGQDSTEFNAMAVLGVSLSFFSEWILNLNYNGSGRIIIADENGTIISGNSAVDARAGDFVDSRLMTELNGIESDFEFKIHRNSNDNRRTYTALRKIRNLPFYVIIEEASSRFFDIILPLLMISFGLIISIGLAWFILKSHLYHMELNKELAQTSSELKTIFDHSMVGIVHIDGDRRILQANKRFAEIAGYKSAEESIGRSISEVHISEENFRRFATYYNKNFLETGSVQLESEFKRTDGRYIWAHVFGKSIDSDIPPDPEKGIIWIVDDITERREARKILLEMATKDELTGLNNRRHFMELGEQEFSRFLRHKRPLSVMMLDLDHFKLINDSFGHNIGDKALIRFAYICAMNLRTGDISGRIGGEEFAVILPDTDTDRALEVAERIRKKTAETSFLCDGNEFSFTVSIGIAPAGEHLNLSKTLNNADKAMYESKSNGRNKVTLYSTDKNTE